MAYSDITFKDKNLIKAWLQNRRLESASRIAAGVSSPRCIIDFGAGNGELCKLLAAQFPDARIICYEPAPTLMEEARQNLTHLPQVQFLSDLAGLPGNSVDLVFCLEVFEHLPEIQTMAALEDIDRLLKPKGIAIIGVPIEIGLPALYKGVFRMTRRFGAYDASIKNVLLATLFSPPKDRPASEIAAGLHFHFEHMGFDYRELKRKLHARFRVHKVITSPFPILGPLMNPEANFLIQKS